MPTGMLFWQTTEEGKAPLGISPSSTRPNKSLYLFRQEPSSE